MAGKFRPKSGGGGRGRLPQRAGGSTAGKLQSSVDGITAALQTQRQAWTEVISSLNEYRAVELPDFSLNVPDVTGWQTLTAEVKAYSAAIAAIPAPTVATFTPAAASGQQPQSVSESSPNLEINQTTVLIDEQTDAWQELATTSTSSTNSLADDATSAMSTSREQLTQTTISIQTQDATWRALATSMAESAASAAPAIASITASVATLTGTILVINHQKAMIASLLSPLASIGSAFVTFGGLAAKGVGMIYPPWKIAMAAVSAGLIVYKVATSEMSIEAFKAAKGNADLTKSVGNFSEATSKLGTAIGGPFATAKAGAESLLQSINPFPFIFGKATEYASGWIDTFTVGINFITPKVIEFGDLLTTAAFVTSSLGSATDAQTQSFYEEGKALRELAEHTEKRIAQMESQRPLFAQLGAMQESAAQAAQHRAELERLSGLTSKEAIEAETRALQQKTDAEIRSGKATPETLKQTGEKFSVLANQSEGVKSGKIKPQESAVDSQIRAARDALFALTHTQDEVAVATLKSKGATDQQVTALIAEQHAANLVTTATDAHKVAIRARDELAKASASIADQNRESINSLKDKIELLNGSATQAEVSIREMFRKGNGAEFVAEMTALNAEAAKLSQGKKAESLTDQIDLLTGAATKSQIAMRELARGGAVDAAQVEQWGKLTAEIDKLNTEKKGTDKITALRDQIDLLSGSATSAQIAMREMLRDGIGEDQAKQIAALTQEKDRLSVPKANKPTAAFQGSKEANEIMLRGVGGGNRMESLAGQQLAELKRIANDKSTKTLPAPAVERFAINPATPAVPKMTLPPMPEPGAETGQQPLAAPSETVASSGLQLSQMEGREEKAPRQRVLSNAEREALHPKPVAPTPTAPAKPSLTFADKATVALMAPNLSPRERFQILTMPNQKPLDLKRSPVLAKPALPEAPKMPVVISMPTSYPLQTMVERPQANSPQIPTAPQSLSSPVNVSAPPSSDYDWRLEKNQAEIDKRQTASEAAAWKAQQSQMLLGRDFDHPEAKKSRDEAWNTARDSYRPEPAAAIPSSPPLVPPAAPLTATAPPASAAPVLISSAASIVIPKSEMPKNSLPPQRAGSEETPKISGVSERVSESRRENGGEKQIVDLLRMLLQEEKLSTAAIKEIEIPNIRMGAV